MIHCALSGNNPRMSEARTVGELRPSAAVLVCFHFIVGQESISTGSFF